MFINVNPNDVQELKVAEAGEEVKVQLVSAEVKPGKNDPRRQVIHAKLKFVEPGYFPIYDYIAGPVPEDEPDTVIVMSTNIANFGEVFGAPDKFNYDPEQLIGNQAYIIVSVEEYEDRETNKVKRYISAA